MVYNATKNEEFIIHFAKYAMILIMILMALGIHDSALSINIKSRNTHDLVSILSLMMYLAATISSLYYYQLKKNSDAIFYLIYFAIAFFLHLSNQTILVCIQEEHLLINLFFINKILIVMTIMPNTNFKNKILERKIIFTFCIVLICLILSYIEMTLFSSKALITNYVVQILFICGNIIYIYVSTIYLKKFKSTKDCIYILWTVFLLSRCLKDFYALVFYNGNIENSKYATLALLIMYIGLIMYSIGVLIISNMETNNKLKDMQDLDVFYNILDNEFMNIEMYILKKNWTVIYANKAVRKQYGISEYNVESFKFLGQICKNKFERFDKKYQTTIMGSLENNSSWRGVIPIRNNNEILLDVKKQISKEHGEIYVVQIDYNKEVIKLKKEVEEKNRMFDVLTEKIGDLIMVTDKDERIKYVNNEVYKLLGCAEDEIIGFKVRDILIDNDNSNYNYNEKIIFKEFHLICKDQKIIDVETLVTPINDQGWIFASRNITYRKELELLKDENEKMKVHQQLKTDFFANLSHELKTPLNIFYSIIQLLDLNLDKKENDFKLSYKKHSHGLKINFYRMLRMITNLIDLTKLDSNFKEVKFNNYDIVRLCEDVTFSVLTYAQQKNIEIIFDTEEEEHIIRCDGEYMERIMLNLLSNAIKYTPNGGEIFVNLIFNEDYVHIKIKDNGIGIPKEKLESIFEKFVRVDKSLRGENEGSGIGLSIVKSLVDLLQGNIYIESTENIGSEFTIEIPNIKLEEGLTDYDVDKERITLELSDVY
ncbi:PAS domain-containing sensor histidine kinase [Terrisporobacter mayombei]|uniref:histidine kinase n=2 Tax=Terrisporobacter mayombei TaxID=1541 RepID=A0ABY9PYQ6_9FIRM|nr:PAS domain-containing sensor histidine kinase [Terrisporobacter mayombei]MCC3868636.1 PAS domain-containing sensor histidine kinase [Terrisporobacter mayombei]WMT80792.1 Adaptive-response sensory-kinase SasA [Terrisporobacter mayombei]